MDSTDRPSVSVILPTVNRGNFLRGAVQTVNDQTFKGIQLIIVDDSEHSSYDLVSDIDHDAIVDLTYIHGEGHESAGAARNTGIRAADAPLLAFLDDDDRWSPTKIQRQVHEFLNGSPSIGVVCTGQQYVDPEGKTRGVQYSTVEGDVVRDIIRGAPVNPFSCIMVHGSTIEEAGYIDEQMRFWEDREWCLRLSRHCEFKSIPEPLTIRTMGDHDQLGDDFEAREDAYQRFLDKHRAFAAEFGPAYERRFVSWLSQGVAISAIRNGHYRRALRYVGRAIRNVPVDPRSYLYLLLAIGGEDTYRSIRFIKRKVNNAYYGTVSR